MGSDLRDYGRASAPAAGRDLVRPVILCGGAGTRLWPLSRASLPKQLLKVAEAATMLQETAARTLAPGFSAPMIVTGEIHRFEVRDQLEAAGVAPAAIILEPCGRNTAAAIALAGLLADRIDPDELLLIMPSDHVIGDAAAFRSAVGLAVPAALNGSLVTFGIEAKAPETGYGYIEAGEPLDGEGTIFRISSFIEKPDLEGAQALAQNPRCFWNGGIFLFKASAYLDELERHAPAISKACRAAMADPRFDGPFCRPDTDAFSQSPALSIDYAVMERTAKGVVVPVVMGWSDVGCWNAVWSIADRDSARNAIRGDVVAIDTRGCLIRNETDITLATLGVEDLVIVATRDAVLVAARDKAQDTKRVVEAVRALGRASILDPPRVHRPWGTYETTDRGERFQTKRIIVKPGHGLSLQLHHRRSEHWIVVSGTARVTIGDEVRLIHENESTYIPAGTVHRLENPTDYPLHLIEVQCGDYLGEDDIVRLEDKYGRAARAGSPVEHPDPAAPPRRD